MARWGVSLFARALTATNSCGDEVESDRYRICLAEHNTTLTGHELLLRSSRNLLLHEGTSGRGNSRIAFTEVLVNNFDVSVCEICEQ